MFLSCVWKELKMLLIECLIKDLISQKMYFWIVIISEKKKSYNIAILSTPAAEYEVIISPSRTIKIICSML